MKIQTSYSFALLLLLFLTTKLISANNFSSTPLPDDSTQHQTIFKTQPFLQNPIGGAVTISWFTNVLTHGWIEFGSDKNLGQKAETRIGGQTVANVNHHKIRIKNLRPGATYFYRACSRQIVKYDAYKKEFGEPEYSETFSFTLPDSESENFTAIIFNDLHKKQRTLHTLMAQVNDVDYDFVVYNGDCIDDPINEDHALNFLSYSNKQVNAAEKPVLYLRGNHEIRGPYSVGLNEILDYVGGQTFGAFNWGDTRFVMLDCGEDKPDSHPVYGGLNNFEQLRNDQVDFLKVETESKAFKKASKRVLIHHIPLYGMRTKAYIPCFDLWSDILNKSEFTLAINGHTHRFAYHESRSLGNAYPIVIGGGYKPEGATVMILEKKGNSMFLKILGCDGSILGEYKY